MRFPEFTGEWETYRLGELVEIKSGVSPTGIIDENGIFPFYKVEQLNNCYIELDETPYRTMQSAVPAHSIIFPKRGAAIMTNKIRIASKACQLDTNLMALLLKNNENVDYKFLFYFIARYNLSKIADTSTIPQINNIHISPIKITLPSIHEQRKISKLLTILDTKIETQKKIIEDLKKLKAAIAEKLFCGPYDEAPELRVANSSASWNLYRLKDVCQRISERNSQESSSLVLTIAAQYGLVSQTDFFNKSVASENLSNYYLIQKGDFAYNKSYSGEYPWGAVKRLELYETGVLSPLYICFKPNPLIVDSDFLSHYFETHKWHNGIAQIAGEGARNHGLLNVSISDYFATLHRLPGLPEQKKIASYLNLLSDIISLANKELKCYSRQKQYLLARMFI